ncbi:type II toxin-antitoxin system RelE/ParE family toxin [Desulfovibrio sp. OttesenSCG-928-C14]|nr:type II toxin-antitoxin system RelE/ParE family toxin [Desulfovibrio sp. OttesenSCG-928-C14]
MLVIWSVSAERDLEAITEYIARDNLQAALALDDFIRDAANGLPAFPRQGKPGRIPGLRELVVHENYIVVYEIAEDEINIITVLHAARQWPTE